METEASIVEKENSGTIAVDSAAKTETIESPKIDDRKEESPPADSPETESELWRKATAEQLEQLEKVERDYSYQMDKVAGVSTPEQDEKATGIETVSKPEETKLTPAEDIEPLKEPEDVDGSKTKAESGSKDDIKEVSNEQEEPMEVLLEPASAEAETEESPTDAKDKSTLVEDKPADIEANSPKEPTEVSVEQEEPMEVLLEPTSTVAKTADNPTVAADQSTMVEDKPADNSPKEGVTPSKKIEEGMFFNRVAFQLHF